MAGGGGKRLAAKAKRIPSASKKSKSGQNGGEGHLFAFADVFARPTTRRRDRDPRTGSKNEEAPGGGEGAEVGGRLERESNRVRVR
ncbi:hypothetical protein NL676_013476 [Syzygium grande]|nr:hypothetical protein NL676_013476 [Syzygium grande]